MDTKCVGFSDCPCPRHRRRRITATAAHPDHRTTDNELCGVCRTKALRHSVIRPERLTAVIGSATRHA